jgi:hypothetical protein
MVLKETESVSEWHSRLGSKWGSHLEKCSGKQMGSMKATPE